MKGPQRGQGQSKDTSKTPKHETGKRTPTDPDPTDNDRTDDESGGSEGAEYKSGKKK